MNPMRRFFNRTRPDAAQTVADQAATARRLVAVDDQELLEHARTNPATRADADALRTERHREQLRLEHRRALRRDRVNDTRANAAEQALSAIAAAREATSPGRAVASLTRHRTHFMVGCLALSVLLSIGSAMAIDTWLRGLDTPQPTGLGYVVEAGLTVLATSMIVLRGLLASRGTVLATWQAVTLWVLIIGPLLASALLATLGSPVGAVCSIGAAAWSVAAYVATTSLSTAISDALADVRETDEAELRRVALDEAGEQPETSHPAAEWVTAQAEVGLDEIGRFLADQHDGPDTGGSGAAQTDPPGHGPTPQWSGIPTRDEVQDAWRRQQAQNSGQTEGHTVADQHGRPEQASEITDGAARTSPAIAARRATGQTNLHRVAEQARTRPDQTVDQMASDLGLSPSTIKRHLRTLRSNQS